MRAELAMHAKRAVGRPKSPKREKHFIAVPASTWAEMVRRAGGPRKIGVMLERDYRAKS